MPNLRNVTEVSYNYNFMPTLALLCSVYKMAIEYELGQAV